jgi:hypothetical protein
MAVTSAQLLAEIQTDPAGLGYGPLLAAGQDWALADVINFVRDGATPCPTNGIVGAAITVRRNDVTSSDIVSAIDVADFKTSLNLMTMAWLTGLFSVGRVQLLQPNGADTPVMANLRKLLNDTNGSLTRLTQVASRFGSRAEQLFGPGTRVTVDDIARAFGRVSATGG